MLEFGDQQDQSHVQTLIPQSVRASKVTSVACAAEQSHDLHTVCEKFASSIKLGMRFKKNDEAMKIYCNHIYSSVIYLTVLHFFGLETLLGTALALQVAGFLLMLPSSALQLLSFKGTIFGRLKDYLKMFHDQICVRQGLHAFNGSSLRESFQIP